MNGSSGRSLIPWFLISFDDILTFARPCIASVVPSSYVSITSWTSFLFRIYLFLYHSFTISIHSFCTFPDIFSILYLPILLYLLSLFHMSLHNLSTTSSVLMLSLYSSDYLIVIVVLLRCIALVSIHSGVELVSHVFVWLLCFFGAII